MKKMFSLGYKMNFKKTCMFGRVPKPTCLQTVLFFLFFFGERTRNPPQKKFDEYECEPMSCALCSFEWTTTEEWSQLQCTCPCIQITLKITHEVDWDWWNKYQWRSDHIEKRHKEQMQQEATHKWLHCWQRISALLEWFPKHSRKCVNNSERWEKQKPNKSKTSAHLVRFMKKMNKIGEVGAVEKNVTTDLAKILMTIFDIGKEHETFFWRQW